MIFAKQSGRPEQYIAIICMTIFLLVSGVLFSLYLLQYRGMSRTATADAQFLYFVDTVQKKAWEETTQPTIRIIGGSGSLYSVSACELGRLLGMPVTNLAFQAGIGMDYLLYRAKKYLRPNDVAVLLFEPQVIANVEPSWVLANWTIPYDYKYFATVPLSKTPQIFSKVTLEEYATRLYAAFRGPRLQVSESFSAMSRAGDLVLNLASRRSEITHAHLEKNTKDPVSFAFPVENIQPLKEFIRWCRVRNIQLIGGYSAITEHSYYSTPEGKKELKAWATFWDSMGIPSIGSPQDFIFPKSLFFDHVYHMHSGGRRIMTTKLAAFLREKIPPERLGPVDTSPIVFLPSNPYPYPCGFIHMAGLSGAEPWGAWTDGSKVEMEFAGSFDKPFTLTLTVKYILLENLQSPIRIRAGGDEKELHITAPGEYSVTLTPKEPATTLSIELPVKGSPKTLGLGEEARVLGLGLTKIAISPCSSEQEVQILPHR